MLHSYFNISGLAIHLCYIFLPVILGSLHIAFKPRPNARRRYANIYFHYFLAISVGIAGLHTGYQLLTPKNFADIDWAYTPFIQGLGIANLAFGILGILSLWINKEGWKAATAIGYGLFLFFAAIGQIIDIFTAKRSLANTGSLLSVNLLVPFALFLLLALRHSYKDDMDSNPKNKN